MLGIKGSRIRTFMATSLVWKGINHLAIHLFAFDLDFNPIGSQLTPNSI